MAETIWRTGQVVWREHVGPDVDRARGFYGELFGWSFGTWPMGDGTYTYIDLGGRGQGGLMTLPGVPSHWMSYVSVADVDAAAAAAAAHGGTVVHGPADIPGVGRFAVLADPTGVHLTAFRAAQGDGPAEAVPSVGAFCWETINSADPERLDAFYLAVFGWEPRLGPGGMKVYAAGEVQVADVQACPPGVPSHVVTHVVVASADDAHARAARLGATILAPRVEVPGVGRLCIIQDPFGAVVSMFEPAFG